jgi:chromosome partitioning protein
MVKVIAVASQKGGVGKTTTVVNLAHGLAIKEREVLVVDVDPQGHAAIALGMLPEPSVFNSFVGGLEIGQVLRQTGRPRLFIVPGDKRTSTAQTVLLAEGCDILESLRTAFVKVFRDRPDIVVFDTAPSVGGFQEAALFAADLVVVPVATDHLALFGATGVLETLRSLQRRGWHGKVVALPTFYDEVTRHSKEVFAQLNERLTAMGLPVLKPVHRSTELREAAAEGKTIFEHSPRSRAAKEYAALVWGVLGMLKGGVR